MQNLDITQDELKNNVAIIEDIIQRNKISETDLLDFNLNMYQLYILMGEDSKALEIINTFKLDDIECISRILLLTNKMKVLLNLGQAHEAITIANALKNELDAIEWPDGSMASVKSGALIEVGKTFLSLNKFINEETGENPLYKDAIDCFEELIVSYESDKYHDIDHYLGAKANKASSMLDNPSEEIQKEGASILLNVIEKKVKLGNWVGVANNYCILGLYYLKIKDYKNALAYTKRDLIITRKYGSLRDQASTLLRK